MINHSQSVLTRINEEITDAYYGIVYPAMDYIIYALIIIAIILAFACGHKTGYRSGQAKMKADIIGYCETNGIRAMSTFAQSSLYNQYRSEVQQ